MHRGVLLAVVLLVVAVVAVSGAPHHPFARGYVVGRHSGYHHGHHHGGCGYCGRKRRDLQSFLQDPKVKDAYKKIAADDKDQCGLRLVCELSQMNVKELDQDELRILAPYPGKGKSDGSIYGNYDEAAWHGKEDRICAEQYPLCAYTAQHIMEEIRAYNHHEDPTVQ